jgi:hypothetical protein
MIPPLFSVMPEVEIAGYGKKTFSQAYAAQTHVIKYV